MHLWRGVTDLWVAAAAAARVNARRGELSASDPDGARGKNGSRLDRDRQTGVFVGLVLGGSCCIPFQVR
jgi:hypothetical protein